MYISTRARSTYEAIRVSLLTPNMDICVDDPIATPEDMSYMTGRLMIITEQDDTSMETPTEKHSQARLSSRT